MKLTCNREKFWQAFQLAGSVTPTRSPKPILENVKLEVHNGVGTLMATDLEVGIRIDVPDLEIIDEGSLALPVKQMGPILRESSDEKLTLDSDGSRVQIHGERSEFQLPTQNPDEYPAVTPFEEEKHHLVAARFFREMLHRTSYATDPESSRYALGGVLLEMTEKEIIGVGTDGRRLARQTGPAKSVGGHKTLDNTVVPTRAVQLLERALADTDEEIQIAIRENDVLVKSSRLTLYSRLVEGRFPKWRDVFPDYQQMTKIELTIGPFHSAVRQAAIVTSDEQRGIEFFFSEGKLTLAGHGAELGESHIELPIAYEGPDVPIKLDPRFLGDFLKVLDPAKTFTLHLKDSENAVVCTTDDGYGYVIMPLAREKKK